MPVETNIESLKNDLPEIIAKIKNKMTNSKTPEDSKKKLQSDLEKLQDFNTITPENYNTITPENYNTIKKSLAPYKRELKRQNLIPNLTKREGNPIVELLAKGIAFILKYANQLFNMLKKLFDEGIISDFEENGLYSTNAIPGLFTVLIVIFLIIFLLWSSIQSFFKWISGGFIKLPDLPISLDKRYTQFVYSFFHLLVSGYLVFVIFISYFNDLLIAAGLGKDNTTPTEGESKEISKNLDIIEIGRRIIKALYLLWIIAIVLVGSTIAKAFYKMACNGANTNIDSFAKIIDSSVVLTLIVSIILIILLKIIDFFNLVVRFFSGNSCSEPSEKDPKNKEEVERSQKILELIFNFDVIYFVLRVITLMYEEFASDNLVFLLGRMGEESPLNNCNPDGDDCDKDNFKETLKNFIIGAILWIASIIVLYIQFKFNKQPTNDLDTKIGDNIKDILEAFVAMLDSKKGSGDKYKDNKSFKDYFTDLKNNMSTAKRQTKTGLPGELKERSKQAANKTGYYRSKARQNYNNIKQDLKESYSDGVSGAKAKRPPGAELPPGVKEVGFV